MISKICSNISKIAKDKILHFIIAYLITDFAISIFNAFNFNLINTIIFSLITALIFIFSKEVIDEYSDGDADWYDIIAGVAGAILKVLILMIFIL